MTACILVIASASCLGLAAKDVLCAARDQLLRIETLDYEFRCSRYPEQTLRFRASGIMTRVDASVPALGSDGKPFVEESVYAFDGEKYQERGKQARVLTFSRHPLDTSLMAGPCWSPVVFCYRWLRDADGRFSWSIIRDPLVWDQLRVDPEAIPGNWRGLACAEVTIHRDNGVLLRVWFCTEKGYFPVRYECFAPDGTKVARLEVSQLHAIPDQGSDMPLWFPTRVEYWQARHGPLPERSIWYEILPNSIRANSPIDRRVFTLDAAGVDNVLDLDGKRVFLPAKGVWVPLAPSERGGVPKREPIKAEPSWRHLYFIAANVVLICIVAGVVWWKVIRTRA